MSRCNIFIRVRIIKEMPGPVASGTLCSTQIPGVSAYGVSVEACTGFWWGNLKERDHWKDPGADRRIILRWIFRKWDVGVWTGSSWLRIGTGGGHL